ncbi:hypothetical protein ACM26V_09365 [Salipaludibacillus sp. HK11]|uniref:hypothetical protein n=1 Tax=Salipaludibacillus sp. HK11 TaxID=3394320 RepID=UPI0039FBE27F
MQKKIFENLSNNQSVKPIEEQISEWLESKDNLTSIDIQFNDFNAEVTYEEEV